MTTPQDQNRNRDSDPPTVPLDLRFPLWDRVFTVAPLVVVGTKEDDDYDLAPKHMAMPLGWEAHYGFVCTPAHATYHNVKEHGAFTVSYPGPDQIVLASLTAAPRCGEGEPTPTLPSVPTVAAREVDGVLLRGAHLGLECELDRIIDGFGRGSLIVGRIVAASAHPDAVRTSEVEDDEQVHAAPLLSYVSPGRYAVISDSNAFPFPAGFRV